MSISKRGVLLVALMSCVVASADRSWAQFFVQQPRAVVSINDARGADQRLDEAGESYTLVSSTDLPGGQQGVVSINQALLGAGYSLTAHAEFVGRQGRYKRICQIQWTLTNTSQLPGANITGFNSGIQDLDTAIQAQLPLAPGNSASFGRQPAAKCGVVHRFIGGPTFNPTAPDLETAELIEEPSCIEGDQLAATLLFPYFEVDLDDVHGKSTLAAVTNGSDSCTLTRVTLWTDFGVPTLGFYLYLSPDDVQTFSFRDLLNGALPDTSSVLSNLHCPVLDFDVCTQAQLQPELLQLDLQSLQANHTGNVDPQTNSCAGSDRGDNIARGYATIDTVAACTFDPTVRTYNAPQWQDPEGFFTATQTTDQNVLWGDFFDIDDSEDSAQSEPAVSIRSAPDRFSPGDYTFYGRYVGFDASDGRVPLSGRSSVRFLNGGPFDGGTLLTVWRDTRSPSIEPVLCGETPDWSPLTLNEIKIFDEAELPYASPGSDVFPLATQQVQVGSSDFPLAVPFGQMLLDLWLDSETPAQSWVTTTLTALGRFSVQHRAVRRDDLCEVSATQEPLEVP